MEDRQIRRFLRRQFAPLSWWLVGYHLLMIVAVLSVQLVHSMAFDATEAEVAGNAWGYLVSSAIGMAILIGWKGVPFWRDRVWAHGNAMTWKAFFCLLALTIGCQMAASLYGMVLESILNRVGLSALSSIESATSGSDTISMFLYAGVCAPIVEELMFRGFVQQSLKPFGKKFAIFGSAFLFGLFHGNLFQSPYAFLVGLVFGYVAMEYSIAWAMLLHMFNNLVLGDVLQRLTMGLPDLALSLIMLVLTGGCAIASLVILTRNGRAIRQYLGREPMDKRCLRGFFLNWGFAVLAFLMGGSMILMLLMP